MRSVIDGPYITYGNDNPQQISNTDAGPSVNYQSDAILDSRMVESVTQAASAGPVPSFMSLIEIECVNAVPQALNASRVAAAQALTNGGFLTLASVNAAGVVVGIPLVPFGTAIQPTALQQSVLALDFGFAIGTTTTGAAAQTVTITGPGTANAVAQRYFRPGQRIIIPGAGLGGVPLVAQVTATPIAFGLSATALAASGTITIDKPALTVATTVGIGSADPLYGVTAYPYQNAGAASIFDASQSLARALTITASGASSGNIIVNGYDVFGQVMTENITIVGSGTANGKKAFKYIKSIQATGAGVTTGTHSVGTQDVFGVPIRCDFWESMVVYMNGAVITSSTGMTFADITSPATQTTGDVRGTYGVQSASDGTKRLFIATLPPQYQINRATNLDARTLVGVPNV